MDHGLERALDKLRWMRAEHIWPGGQRYLWTDAFGVVLLVSLYEELGQEHFLDEAEHVVAEVDRVLGRPRGYRIGEAADRDGQYYHYLAMWMYALNALGAHRGDYAERAVQLVRDVHARFVLPHVGVIWKMQEDLSEPYGGSGLGALDPFHGYVVYRALDEVRLAPEIDEMRGLVERWWPNLYVTQDLGLGMMLWFAHFQPEETWARTLRQRALDTLDTMWMDPPGYFCREPRARHVKFAFTNHGVSIGLQSVGQHPARVQALQRFFETYRSHDEYDRNAITHVMAACALWPGRLIRREPARRTARAGEVPPRSTAREG